MRKVHLLYKLNDLIVCYTTTSDVNDCLSENYSTFSEAVIIKLLNKHFVNISNSIVYYNIIFAILVATMYTGWPSF